MYLPLGQDVLVPEVSNDDPMPMDFVGPFELRSETLAGALQLILADYDVSLAFETDAGMTRHITVANLRGPLNNVVKEVCSLANLYCAYQNGVLTVKETQTFTVKIPPISQDTAFMQNVGQGLQAIIGKAPVIDSSTRTLIYEATQRNAEMAERYFQRMRSSTALIVFETYVWEVQLNSGNSTGIKWDQLFNYGKFGSKLAITGGVGADFTNPISIGLPSAIGNAATSTDIFNFLSTFGAVKTVSQPQITVLSGSTAKLRAANTRNYVAQVAQTITTGQATTSVNTSSVDTGFTLQIGSGWDNATVYANIDISLSDVTSIDDFDFSSGAGGTTKVQLPKTTQRELTTQVRIRPGDSLLIAGLVQASDTFNSSGPGFMKPLLPASRTAETTNLELVFLLRPRVIVFTSPTEEEYYNAARGHQVEDKSFNYDFAPLVSDAQKNAPAKAPASPAPAQSPAAPPPVASSPYRPSPLVLPPSSVTVFPLQTSGLSGATPAVASGAPLPLGGSVSSDALNPDNDTRNP
jgi:type II secretory pathway component GspD/PulD (secretin)